MPRTVFLYALLISLLITGCGQPVTPLPLKTPAFAFTPVLPVVADEWTIKMTHSGGIMGLRRSIKISSDGSYTVRDERANKTVTGELSNNELATLRKIVAILDDNDLQKPGPSSCADCFIYDLEIHSSERNIIIQLDDISLPESNMEQVITYLRGLLEATLK